MCLSISDRRMYCHKEGKDFHGRFVGCGNASHYHIQTLFQLRNLANHFRKNPAAGRKKLHLASNLHCHLSHSGDRLVGVVGLKASLLIDHCTAGAEWKAPGWLFVDD